VARTTAPTGYTTVDVADRNRVGTEFRERHVRLRILDLNAE
jgi:hypothetical protein